MGAEEQGEGGGNKAEVSGEVRTKYGCCDRWPQFNDRLTLTLSSFDCLHQHYI